MVVEEVSGVRREDEFGGVIALRHFFVMPVFMRFHCGDYRRVRRQFSV